MFNKNPLCLLVCFFSLPFLLLGCGETQESLNLMGPTDSAQALPADHDIQGLYNLEVPQNWDQTEYPVIYVKYFRAKLLRRFGNIPEVHTVANMELKRRQRIALTPDEKPRILQPSIDLCRIKRGWQPIATPGTQTQQGNLL